MRVLRGVRLDIHPSKDIVYFERVNENGRHRLEINDPATVAELRRVANLIDGGRHDAR